MRLMLVIFGFVFLAPSAFWVAGCAWERTIWYVLD